MGFDKLWHSLECEVLSLVVYMKHNIHSYVHLYNTTSDGTSKNPKRKKGGSEEISLNYSNY